MEELGESEQQQKDYIDIGILRQVNVKLEFDQLGPSAASDDNIEATLKISLVDLQGNLTFKQNLFENPNVSQRIWQKQLYTEINQATQKVLGRVKV
ncbi:MAG: hypothetical protein EZS28_032140 [Streblomastix strix]|uniref:Uncharacterized protein n=1 Tax=Streblomastix strix TaxID=222440 RepID=A0A5J4UPV5_9EUKA|nr:MAG: hypothetical protein EZS28_032140 [Streblomastix strix]